MNGHSAQAVMMSKIKLPPWKLKKTNGFLINKFIVVSSLTLFYGRGVLTTPSFIVLAFIWIGTKLNG